MNPLVITLLLCLLPQSAPAPGRGPATIRELRGSRVEPDQEKKPPLIEWQRGFTDAFEVAAAEGRPVLLCANMDGESASETFARTKYRDPEFAKLVAPYVPLIVSVDRHNPRDHDEAGRRIPCPRFGRVTCGEHIEAEPLAFALYFRGNAVAPRHIGVEPGGLAIFDRFLETDLSVIDESIRRHGGALPTPRPPKDARELVNSRDANDRVIAEANYLAGDAAARATLLGACAASRSEPFDVIRLGLRDQDAALREAARAALAATATPAALDLLLEALREADGAPSRPALLGALVRLAPGDARARGALRVLDALRAASAKIDVEAWRKALAAQGAPKRPAEEADEDQVDRRVGELGKRVQAAPADASAQLELAKETLRYATLRLRRQANPTFLLEDAKRAALAAEKAGASAWAAKAVRARAADLLGQSAEAGSLASEAVRGALADPASEAAAEVLRLVGESGPSSIANAVAQRTDWDPPSLTDAHAAFTVLAFHPLGTDAHAAAHVDLLQVAGAQAGIGPVLEAGLRKFPASAPLHARLRDDVLARRGVEALEGAYDGLLASSPDAASTQWFAGYATLVGAEFYQRGGKAAAAGEAYERAIARFEKSVAANQGYADSAQHYVAMAKAGLARLALDTGDLAKAASGIVTALELRPAILGTEDGLGRTPLATATLLYHAAVRAGRDDLRSQVEEAARKAGTEIESRPAR